jgi:O-6-methylguanine DNA methyltransferase
VYRALRGVKRGRTVTYGELAARAGGGPRAVGGALAANPVPLIVPCHRVVRADGGCGGFSAPGGVALKRRMLELERRCGPSSSRFLRGGTEARAGNAAPGPMGSAPPFVRRARRSRRRDGARPPVGGTAGGAHR